MDRGGYKILGLFPNSNPRFVLFSGLAVMVLMGPLNAIVARNMKALQIEQMKNKDKRNKMMDEILNGMKIIKLYAWEESFRHKWPMSSLHFVNRSHFGYASPKS